MTLPGKALALALIIWREAGMKKRLTVALPPSKVREAGIHPAARRRALRQLCDAGLIAVEHKPGCAMRITLLDALPTPEGAGNG
jgi:hypothetical protein